MRAHRAVRLAVCDTPALRRPIRLLLLVALLGLAFPSVTLGADLETRIRLSFREGCAGSGTLLVRHRYAELGTVAEQHVRWSPDRPIAYRERLIDRPSSGSVTLLDRDDRVVFRARLRPTPSGRALRYIQTLDCSSVPYQPIVPETAAASGDPDRPTVTRATLAGAALVGSVGLLAGVGWLWRPPRPLRARRP